MTGSNVNAESGIDWGNVIIALVAGGVAAYVIYNIGVNTGVAKTKMISSAPDGKKKYSIFLSSTYKNLVDERKEIRDTLSKAGLFVNAMEGFSASDEEKIKLIESRIIESDYFVLIIGNRYGTLIPDKETSFTEHEYDYAVKNRIPVLPFILTNSDETDESDDNKEKLNAFIKKVDRKSTCHCSINDLLSLIPISINDAITATPRPGWIKNSEAGSI